MIESHLPQYITATILDWKMLLKLRHRLRPHKRVSQGWSV
jgi:hypothetical protein